MKYPKSPIADPIPALLPLDAGGTQFVCYGDACSGIPGAKHATTFASVNAIAARIWPPPQFICFLGDHVSGLTRDYAALRQQWRYWLDHEMAWLDRAAIPLFHTTSNHVTYDRTSEAIFREMLPDLPCNGPPGQEGLSYFIRRGNLLMVFVNTSYSGLGGDGFVETEWLTATLAAHRDAQHKLVLGHQPVHSINGYAGAYMRDIAPANAARFWNVLVAHRVTAYLCSHMLAFDVQVHQGVLQIHTAGAGTAHLLPGEYLHLMQLAIDDHGLRYQVLDTEAAIRESLSWPIDIPAPSEWQCLQLGIQDAPVELAADAECAKIMLFEITGSTAAQSDGCRQTLLSGCNPDSPEQPLWIGLRGIDQQLSVIVAPTVGRSPQIWHGPSLEPNQPFSVQVAIHTGMGPGGFLYRARGSEGWTSFGASSTWGPERLPPLKQWTVGNDRSGVAEQFRGAGLQIKFHSRRVARPRSGGRQ